MTRLKRRTAIIYYDRNDIEVTSNHLAIGADFYPLRAIDDARVQARSVPGPLLVTAALAPSEIVLVALTAHGTSAGLTGIVLAATFGLSVLAGLAAALVWPRRYELWIAYDGVPTRVFSSPEEWRVRQLTRALVRALSDRSDSGR